MSLTQRKPRPIKRSESTLRDDRLFIVACDDTYAPKQYFGFFRLPRIQVHVVETTDGSSSAKHVLNRLLEYKKSCHDDDELWMVLDTDHYTSGTHIKGFVEAIKKARATGVNVALSKPCFELWLLLHHLDGKELVNLKDANDVENTLRVTLGGYDKRNLKEKDYPVETLKTAIKRAEVLDKSIGRTEIPIANTSRIYLLWKALANKALQTQLPHYLK